MAARSTEIMVRQFIIEELQKKDIKVSEHPSYTTPRGRLEPDLLLQNGGDYIVETKLGGDIFDAVKELYEYKKYIKVNGGFAVVIPDKLRTSVPIDWLREMANSPNMKYSVVGLFSDKRTATRMEGNLDEISTWIVNHVLRPPQKIEVETSLVINILRGAVSHLRLGTQKLKTEELEDIFGGKSVFENILQYTEKKYPIKEMRDAAAYLLINQIMFYHVLSLIFPSEFESLDEEKIKRPSDLKKYFEKVLTKNYTPVFGFDISTRLSDKALVSLKNVIQVIKALEPEKIGHDILGKIFHDLIPFEIRKAVAAFYTNNEAADFLAALTIDNPNDKVMDLAVGSGTLLVSSYRRKRALSESFDADMHKKFLTSDLTGIDIMPFAAHLAVVNLSLQESQYKTDKVRIAVWDSTTLKPDKIIPAISLELKAAYKRTTLDMFEAGKIKTDKDAYIKKGSMATGELGKGEIPLNKADVIIMNPPFTRQERIPRKYKDELTRRFDYYNKYIHGQLGLFGYFILLADRFLEKNGKLGLVLPATILSRKACEGIRKYWSRYYVIDYIIITSERLAFSESVLFKEILLVAHKAINTNNKTKIVVLKKFPKTMEGAIRLEEKIGQIKDNFEDEDLEIRTHNYSKLQSDFTNWYKYIALNDLDLVDILEDMLYTDKLTKLSFLESHRLDLDHVKFKDFHGFIIRDKSRAERRTDHWIVDKIQKDAIMAKHKELDWKVKIPKYVINNGLRRFSNVKRIDVSKNSDYFIVSWFNDIRRLAEVNLTNEELKGFDKSVVDSWNVNFKSRKANLLLARRPYLASPGTSAIAFYSDIPIAGPDLWSIQQISKDYAKILTLWLNSSFNILQLLSIGVASEGSWMKIHDYMISYLYGPKQNLSKEEVSLLIKTFDSVKNEELPSILNQFKEKHHVRKKIDNVFLQILGKKLDLDDFYGKLVNEFKLIK